MFFRHLCSFYSRLVVALVEARAVSWESGNEFDLEYAILSVLGCMCI